MVASVASTFEGRRKPASGPVEVRPSPIDHAYLGRYTMGNRELEAEVLQLFIDQAPSYLEQLRTAGDEKAWHAAAHTLKGSARAVGALRVGELAERAEALTLAGSTREQRATVLGGIEQALGVVRVHIEDFTRTA